MSRFDGKSVLVTGAARGIGFAAAHQMGLEGASVFITDIDAGELENALTQLKNDGINAKTAVQDVGDVAQWSTIIDQVVAEFGKLDVLVNNAGIGKFASIEETETDLYDATMNINVKAVFYGSKKAIEVMKASGGGAIVNVSSIAAMVGEPALAAYCTSKGAVRSLTKATALDCARKGYNIRVNSVHPGYAQTKLVNDAVTSLGDQAGAFSEALMSVVPMGRLADPSEIGKPIAFLASDDASFMTGAELVVDGGYTIA